MTTFLSQFSPYLISEEDVKSLRKESALAIKEAEEKDALLIPRMNVEEIEGAMTLNRKAWKVEPGSFIYTINFVATDKIYVGSTSRWPRRAATHLSRLSLGKHQNPYLQKAYNKYADKGVWVSVLEKLPKDTTNEDLLKREEYWIVCLRACDPNRGFNISRHPMKGMLGVKRTPEQVARKREDTRRYMRDPNNQEMLKARYKIIAKKGGVGVPKSFRLFDQNGSLVEIYNLRQFCRDRGLKYMLMMNLVQGKQVAHRGWTMSPNAVAHGIRRDVDVISPSGERIQMPSVKSFFQKYGLSRTAAYQLVSGIIPQYKGWKIFTL